MKKLIAFLLCTLLLILPLYPAVSAESAESGIEHFDDGSYMTVTYSKPYTENPPDNDNIGSGEDYNDSVAENAPSALTRLICWFKDILNKIFAKQSTVTKTKYCNYFSSDGELLWSVSLKGKFTYNHRKAVCVSSEMNYEILDSDWKMISTDHTEDGNTARGEFTIKQYKLGVPLKTIERTLTLACNKNGNVS